MSFIYSIYEVQKNTITGIQVNANPNARRILQPILQDPEVHPASSYFGIHALILPHRLKGLANGGGKLRNQVIQEIS
jgi:hypothetical protein